MPTEDDLREALEGMVDQFAYRIRSKEGGRAFWSGGLSALEQAFHVLGWADPHEVSDGACEIAGCHDWATCVGPYPRSRAKANTDPNMIGFGFLCTNHYFAWSGREAVAAEDLGRAK
jgi:hypothetical protein